MLTTVIWALGCLLLQQSIKTSASLTLHRTLPFSPRKVVLLHMHNNAPFFSRLGALTLSNKARYASRHDYELTYHGPEGTSGLWEWVSCDTPEATAPPSHVTVPNDANSCLKPDSSFKIDARAPTFGKIKLALAACRTRKGHWMLWTDADAMVVNQTMPLESIIDDRYDIILTSDWLMINAGMIIFKCSEWTQKFLQRVYDAREFDSARALDQSALQHFFDTEPDVMRHVKQIPKYAMNVYLEEYRPGDFLLHMAGKLYEATTSGATAIAHQFDILSMIDDVNDIDAFFQSQYFLNTYSGTCDHRQGEVECRPEDTRRIKFREPLLAMSVPNRYRHVGLRYYWLQDWKDKYDVDNWNENRVHFDPSGVFSQTSSNETGNKQCEENDSKLSSGQLEADRVDSAHDEL